MLFMGFEIWVLNLSSFSAVEKHAISVTFVLQHIHSTDHNACNLQVIAHEGRRCQQTSLRLVPCQYIPCHQHCIRNAKEWLLFYDTKDIFLDMLDI